ncbi:DUF2249 domain-containing protein [Halosimplex amylolyticum]|uniref:DUF2249 domain-containing protein n=1 Tax=Halosimplex amylolyticum TaxID=3396616 RepID=UPI003F570C0F
MTTLELRPVDRDENRERLFETLAGTDAGETVTIVADRDAGVLFHHYQIKRDHRLRWETDQRDDGAVEHRVTTGEPVDEDGLTDFDVRDMPPQRRHEVLTDTFDRLGPGEGFVLVNDHDPKPLYHELRSTRGDGFEWEYLNRDPQEWRVEIVKTDETESVDDDVVASFDVREIPKRERHPTIHHRYGNVAEGETMEIVAPHEPRPLRHEFRQRYGESFTWEVAEQEPGRCRVRITKGAEGREGDEGPAGVPETAVDSDSLTVTEELDVRDLPPAQRHERIFDAYADLRAGEGFVLVNDHDPKPLYHQFDAEAGDEFRWEYRQRDPGEFRVLVGKGDVTDSGTGRDESVDAPF